GFLEARLRVEADAVQRRDRTAVGGHDDGLQPFVRADPAEHLVRSGDVEQVDALIHGNAEFHVLDDTRDAGSSLALSEGLRPSASPTRALARRFAGALRARGSLAALARGLCACDNAGMGKGRGPQDP